MAINRANMENYLEPILEEVVLDEKQQIERKYDKVFNVSDSSKNKETIAGVSGFDTFSRKYEGVGMEEDAYYETAKTEIEMYTYGKYFTVTREQIEDTQYQEAAKKARSLTYSQGETEKILAWNVFNNGFDSSYAGGDGKELLKSIAAIAEDTWNELD